MTLATKINAARAFGSIDFANGLPAIPGCSKDCMDLICDMTVGSGAADVMRAWLSGWMQANLAA